MFEVSSSNPKDALRLEEKFEKKSGNSYSVRAEGLTDLRLIIDGIIFEHQLENKIVDIDFPLIRHLKSLIHCLLGSLLSLTDLRLALQAIGRLEAKLSMYQQYQRLMNSLLTPQETALQLMEQNFQDRQTNQNDESAFKYREREQNMADSSEVKKPPKVSESPKITIKDFSVPVQSIERGETETENFKNKISLREELGSTPQSKDDFIFMEIDHLFLNKKTTDQEVSEKEPALIGTNSSELYEKLDRRRLSTSDVFEGQSQLPNLGLEAADGEMVEGEGDQKKVWAHKSLLASQNIEELIMKESLEDVKNSQIYWQYFGLRSGKVFPEKSLDQQKTIPSRAQVQGAQECRKKKESQHFSPDSYCKSKPLQMKKLLNSSLSGSFCTMKTRNSLGGRRKSNIGIKGLKGISRSRIQPTLDDQQVFMALPESKPGPSNFANSLPYLSQGTPQVPRQESD